MSQIVIYSLVSYKILHNYFPSYHLIIMLLKEKKKKILV